MATQHARSPYSSTKPSLVISIDLGTTFSGASYSVLTPNQVPKIIDVSGFKGQENLSSSTKVPSILLYNSLGNLVSCGSEIDEALIEDDGFVKVEWFKLLLRPASLGISLQDAPETRLPANRTVVQVMGDYFKYMKRCVQDYVQLSHIDGPALWAKLGGGAHYILTHPNGWGGYQQVQMREAAVLGGLVPNKASAYENIEFVTEGEASFHWCIDIGLATDTLTVDSHIIVADAGGGTIDVSSFKVSSLRPLKLDETAAAECRVAGSVFVTQAFKVGIEEKLKSSPYGDDEHIERAIQEFDKKTKCLFRDRQNVSVMKIGSRKDHDPERGIRLGQLSLEGDFIASTFEKSCAGTAAAILEQLRKNGGQRTTVFLVGGFAASPWLFSETKRRLSNEDCEVMRADSHTAKAVAHGAIALHLDRYISSRIAKYTYGTGVAWHYSQLKPSHIAHSSQIYVDSVTGDQMVNGGFQTLMIKGETIKADAVYRTTIRYCSRYQQPARYTSTIERYTGIVDDIEFHDADVPASFYKICTFQVEIPAVALKPFSGSYGQYWATHYDVVVNIGSSELTCHVEWQENGETRRGIASSVWEGI